MRLLRYLVDSVFISSRTVLKTVPVTHTHTFSVVHLMTDTLTKDAGIPGYLHTIPFFLVTPTSQKRCEIVYYEEIRTVQD
jgi:hypothetical protein